MRQFDSIMSVDIETYCHIPIKYGTYRYAEHCEVGIFGYKFDDLPAYDIDCFNNELPKRITDALVNPRVLKKAWNAAFERACLQAYYGIELPADQWECTMVRAGMCGLPLALDNCARVLGLAEQKDKRGSALIKLFSIPIAKPLKKDGYRRRNTPNDFPEAWQEFRNYCRQDVIVESQISKTLDFYKIPEREHAYWCMDQYMAERGVTIDTVLARNAVSINEQVRIPLVEEAIRITGLENPNSVKALKEWLNEELETDDENEIKSLAKAKLEELKIGSTPAAVRVIEIRQELSKTSVTKYGAMLTALNADGRVRGLIQYYGANRTGRAAGRLVQIHNLPKGRLKNIDLPRNLLRKHDAVNLEFLYGAVPETLSALIRTVFIASPGKRLLISDFSSIEARVISWLSGEEWRLEVFRTHGKIYEASAAQMFRVPFESIGKDSPYRDKGKVAELALGYQGSVGALLTMGALTMGIPEYELEGIVSLWRRANPKIVKYWYDIQNACKHCLRTGDTTTMPHGIRFELRSRYLFITLPSGRKLSYFDAKLEDKGDGYGLGITYYGMGDGKKKVWSKQHTYGGKLVENIVQAIARDLLYHGLNLLDEAGFNLLFHVHDEAVCEEVDRDEPEMDRLLEEMNTLLSTNPDWAMDLPLGAEGFTSLYYKK